MTPELKTVHSFWTPLRILDKLKSAAEELEKEKGIRISPNQLAMNIIDIGLNDEVIMKKMEALPKGARLPANDSQQDGGASPTATGTTPKTNQEMYVS